MSGRVVVAALVVALVAVIGVPLIVGHGEFTGADDRGRNAIAETHTTYRPWARPLWTPPGASVESGLFALQAAAGAFVLGYVVGWRRGKRG